MSLKPQADHPVYQMVKQIPAGKVMTYGQIASLCGVSNPRHVGYLLHHNPDPETIPCHRVVNAQGQCAPNFAFGLATAQQQLLEGEGIEMPNGRVDLKRYLYLP